MTPNTMKIKTFKIGGIHMDDHKIAARRAIEPAPLPQKAIFPLSQHIGAPAKPVVKKGDKVKVGTLLAEAAGFISAPIHSSVSGTVFKIDQAVDASGYQKPVIIVNVEGDDWESSIDRSEKLETIDSHPELDPKEIVERVKTAGVTGMGGAGFPTYVKLMPPEGSVECVILNGVECEPYITSDHRLMLEHAAEIVEGLRIIMRAVGVKRGYIGIEVNKPDAIEIMEKTTAADDSIEVVPLKQAYPQGGEKQLIDAVINRRVPMPPAIPANVGAVVDNVATAFAVYQAVMKRKPLIERVVTVSGMAMKQSGNFLVRMGTSAASLIELCGGLPEGRNKVLSGGPMMGKALTSLDAPIVKGSNAVTVLTGDDTLRKQPRPCVRCAKCVGVCPMGLEPYLLATASAIGDWERAEHEYITSCIECGSCQYTCPSARPLLDNIRKGKATVMGIIKARKQQPKP